MSPGKKPFREEKQGGFINDVDSDEDARKEPNAIQSEFLGGTGEDDGDVQEDIEGDVSVRRQAILPLPLEECKSLLRRDTELARANAPGRHKESDVQMKCYTKVFGAILQMPLPQVSTSGGTNLNASLPLDSAVDFQRAVVKEMRREQSEMMQATETITEASIDDLQNLHLRNQAKEDEACVTVPLEDAMKGPGHVAWKLIQDSKTESFAFNDEQILVIALCIWPLEHAWRIHIKKLSHATVNTLRKLANDLGLPRIIIIGGGGCGKTTLMQVVVVPTLRTFFEKVVLTAPSNRAARGFDPSAKTLHSISGLRPVDSLRTSNLQIKSDRMRKRMDANQTHAGAWAHDEALQTAAALWHAACLKTTYARETFYNLDPTRYAMPNEILGRTSCVVLTGDHLQLPPVPKESGFLAPMENKSDEHKAGAAMFNNMHYLFEMHTMKRFNDTVLVSILSKMRKTGGSKLSELEWQALMDTEVDGAHLERDPEAFLNSTTEWYESAYLWSVVSMACYSRAKASARHHQQILFFCQAVDVSEQLTSTQHRDKELYKQMLAVPSVAQTNRLPGMVLLHISMRVRITTQVLPPWAVQDATGVVMEIEASSVDKHRCNSLCSGDAHPAAELKLSELPPGVYVKLDNCDREFLPPLSCQQHRHAGFSNTCEDCKKIEGWILIQPITRTWTFTDPVTRATLSVRRTQLPLMPAKACPLYSLQGATCDPGLIAHYAMPNRADDDIKWLIVYVLLSRVRSLANLRSVGLTIKIKHIIEGGPPTMLAENFERLFRKKIDDTKAAATAAKVALGWQ